MRKGWIAILVGTMAAFTLALGGTWVFTQTSQASAAEVIESVTVPALRQAVPESVTVPELVEGRQSHVGARQVVAPNRGVRGDDSRPQRDGLRGGPKGDHEALLAEALGISVEELQAAHEAARAAGISQALADGVITQEQADRLLSSERNGPRAEGRRGSRGKSGSFGGRKGNIDRGALLAEALGITPEQLQAAQEQAHDAAIQQAIDEGLITQEQADLMEAHRALKDYLDREALMAQALGITVEELQAAREAGQSHRELIEELGLDAATLRENMQAAHEAAIQQAVADGVITQEQADQIQSGEGRGKFGAPRGRGGDGFRGGEGRRGGDGFRGGEGRRGGDGFRAPRGNGNFNGNGAPSQNNNTTFPASDA